MKRESLNFYNLKPGNYFIEIYFAFTFHKNKTNPERSETNQYMYTKLQPTIIKTLTITLIIAAARKNLLG